MIGKPKFKLGDNVRFSLKWGDDGNGNKIIENIVGVVHVVDSHGIFGDPHNVYYDILGHSKNSDQEILYKHVIENLVSENK